MKKMYVVTFTGGEIRKGRPLIFSTKVKAIKWMSRFIRESEYSRGCWQKSVPKKDNTWANWIVHYYCYNWYALNMACYKCKVN